MQASELHEYLSLNSQTGKLFWKPRGGLKSNLWGKEAFTSKTSNGYVQGSIKGQKLYAHRVVFAMVHGRWPEHQIDHINGNKEDNRPENLQDVTHSQNAKNMPKCSKNTSGHIGVHWMKRSNKWGAQIKADQKVTWLGVFLSKEDAIAARKSAEKLFGFHENHGERNA